MVTMTGPTLMDTVVAAGVVVSSSSTMRLPAQRRGWNVVPSRGWVADRGLMAVDVVSVQQRREGVCGLCDCEIQVCDEGQQIILWAEPFALLTEMRERSVALTLIEPSAGQEAEHLVMWNGLEPSQGVRCEADLDPVPEAQEVDVTRRGIGLHCGALTDQVAVRRLHYRVRLARMVPSRAGIRQSA